MVRFEVYHRHNSIVLVFQVERKAKSRGPRAPEVKFAPVCTAVKLQQTM